MVSSRLHRGLYELFAFYAIFVGVTSYRYDFKQRLFKNTKWTQLIASMANVVQFGIIIMDMAWIWLDVIQLQGVTCQTIQLDATVNDSICLVRILQRVSRERATRNIGKELRCISGFYRYRWAGEDKLDKQNMRRLERIYLVKNCIMWLLVVFLFIFTFIAIQFFGLKTGNIYVECLLIVVTIFAMDSQDVTMHLHFLLSWRICRLYMRLNSHIRRLVRGNSPEDTLELQHLRWQHLKLTSLMHRLTAAYDVVLICNRLSLIVSATALGYYISVFQSFPTIYQIVGYALYAVFAVDGYVLDRILDWTVNEQRKALSLLRQHYELAQPDTQLSRGCDLFALQITCFPMQIKPFGLLTCSTATWLSNISCIISWMVVLLQYRIVSETKIKNK